MSGRRGRRQGLSLLGALLFFLTMAVAVTCAVLVYARVSESGASRARVAWTMLGVVAALSLVCTLCDLLRRRYLVERPVRRILDAAGRIASGDFSVRLEPRHSFERYDEYDLIMEHLDRMAAELSKTEVLRADFVSNVSHELKTPLSVIRNYAAALREGGLPEEQRQRYADTLVSASDRLSALVTDVLKLNRLENQELLPAFERVELGEQLRQAVLGYEEPMEAKGLELDCEIEDLAVSSAPGCLELVWNNLLSNAVKFTPPGGRISVSLRASGERAVVSVSDTGCGISAETGAHIFEKFYQGDASHAQEGNGLGLALVRKVIDLLGGEISVESTVGEGSTFTVSLRGLLP